LKPPRILQRQHICQGNQRPDTLDLLEQRHFRIALCGELLDLSAGRDSVLQNHLARVVQDTVEARPIAQIKPNPPMGT